MYVVATVLSLWSSYTMGLVQALRRIISLDEDKAERVQGCECFYLFFFFFFFFWGGGGGVGVGGGEVGREGGERGMKCFRIVILLSCGNSFKFPSPLSLTWSISSKLFFLNCAQISNATYFDFCISGCGLEVIAFIYFFFFFLCV